MELGKPIEVSKENARRFLVLRQGFLRGKGGKEGTLDAIRRLGCIQTDPINVVHRNQHLVLHNRVVDYKPEHLEELLYKDRLAFEYWCNEKSIIPFEDFHYFRYRMENSSQFHSPYYEHIKEKRKKLRSTIDYIISEITKRGPLSSQDIEQQRKIKGNVTNDVLNLLWDCGALMIHHQEANRRYYDLTKRVLPLNTDLKVPSREEFERFMIRKYMKAYGLVDVRDWRFGWQPFKMPRRRTIVKEMVEDDRLSQVRIEDVNHTYYVLKEDSGFLQHSDRLTGDKIHFIAPLDNLIWNRKMVTEIFNFDYTWEVYKVPEKRIYGYYVMPILRGTRFIGRLDPKLDRQNEEMVVNSLTLIDKEFDEGLTSELVASLQRFLKFHSVSHVRITKTQPEELKARLMRELE